METCANGVYHFHLMLQFHASSDSRRLQQFFFEDLKAGASVSDICGEGMCRKKLQQSIDRGFFYVFADKLGTVFGKDCQPFTAGNYMPVWTSCKCRQVLGKWPENLWKQYKASDEVYEELLFLCRDGVLSRKRNLDACVQRQEGQQAQATIQERIKRIRGNSVLFQPFAFLPAAHDWLQLFKRDELRYPILIARGPSRSGKTEWAKSLFSKPLELKVGNLEVFPDGMRAFKRNVHDGIVLDDVRDLGFLVFHQEKIQGKCDYCVEFGSTAGGTCAFHLDLFAIPIVATINGSTRNQNLLETDDFLSNPGNRVLVEFPPTTAADEDACVAR